MTTSIQAALLQLEVDARTAVGAVALAMDRGDRDSEPRVLEGALADVATSPSVVAAARHFKATAKRAHGKRRLLRVDELEPHEFSFAKKAAAFFSMARSISSSL